MNNADFKYTGSNIPVPLEKCIDFVTEKLKKYDCDLRDNVKVETSPYNTKLVMKTENGKFIEIPVEVQNEAIRKYLVDKGFVDDTETEEDSEQTIEPKIKRKGKKSKSNNILFIVLAGLLLMLCGFYYMNAFGKNK